ncbi:MAG: glycosyltransferase [Candidatus Eisenbacteria bacterium]
MSAGHPTVLHFLSGDQWAGAEVQACHLMAALAARGRYRPRAILLCDGLPARRLRESGIPVAVIDEGGRSFLSLVREARALVRDWSPSLVHGHGYKENLLAWLSSRGLPVKRVRTQHGTPYPEGSFRHRLHYRLDRAAARRAFVFTIAVSEGVAAEVGRFLPAEKIVLVRNGVPAPPEEETAPEASLPRGAPAVVSVGRLSAEKRFDRLIDAVARLTDEFPELRLVLVGDGPERAPLEDRARELLGGRATFTGFQESIGPWIRRGTVYALSSDREGMPMSVLEALARGAAVAAVPVGGVPEVVRTGRTGVLAEAVSAPALADAIAVLLRDPDLRARVGGEGRELVRREFSIDRTAGETEAVYALAEGAR